MMGESRSEPRRRAEVVVSTSQLDADVRFFQEVLGFRIESVFPADAPRITVMSGYGLTIRLDRSATCNPASLRLECEPQLLCKHAGAELVAPGGCHVRLVSNADALQLPSVCQTLELSRGGESACWGTGRAGMQYRDLISQREGGRFIASHIRIPGGGPVPDYVHYHKIRFQMIYCYHGWVRLSYEDQGPPFVMQAGDCVLQPPQIRHRVLESGDGLEVIEIGCPAEHVTCVDHDLTLPSGRSLPERLFDGQRFVCHRVEQARWQPTELDGFESRDLGIAEATSGLAGVRVLRAARELQEVTLEHDGEFLFHFVLRGAFSFVAPGNSATTLEQGDALTIPAALSCTYAACSPGLEILEVRLPA